MWLDWSKRSHRGLRTWILVLLSKESKNGAEIMDSMEVGSKGWWRPSPGSVYPMLQQMADEGLIKRREADGRYEITPQGREESEWPARVAAQSKRSVEGAMNEISGYVALLEDLAQSKDSKIREEANELKELGSRLTKLGESA